MLFIMKLLNNKPKINIHTLLNPKHLILDSNVDKQQPLPKIFFLNLGHCTPETNTTVNQLCFRLFFFFLRCFCSFFKKCT